MKNLIYILLAVIILTACDDDCDPIKVPGKTDTVYVPCNAPVKIPGVGYHAPPAHTKQSVSYDYKYLAFKNHENKLQIIDLLGGNVSEYDLHDYLPEDVQIKEIEYLDWSPYDNRLLIQAKTFTDTLEVGEEKATEWNLYIFDTSSNILENISPVLWAIPGSHITNRLYFSVWMPQSVAGHDIFILNGDFYILQEQKFSSDYKISKYIYSRPFVSKDGNYMIAYGQREYFGEPYYIYRIYKNTGNVFNNVERASLLYNILDRATKISWSPDSKYIAISAATQDWYREQDSARKYFEIWILEFEKMYAYSKSTLDYVIPDHIINLRFDFCKYSFNGHNFESNMGTEFISDTTMAVSMHEDGAEYSYLYEISIHGEMIRQLTFEP